ncbi:MAG: OFA family MFS transporter [Gemmatimonadota bacterium]|nr:OFA family MFS transporter [Gemmatimonadota bacterium]MDH3423349.1 OFA family MFS transporter [Gemmatimonadota bacterium]
MNDPTRGRWLLAGAAVLVQLALGAVYAWSVFVNPFIDQMGWSRTQTTLPFTVAIGVIFIGTLVGGRIQDRIGPRPVVLVGGVIYSIGMMLASLVETPDQLWLLILTYGLIAGLGLGAGYIVPIAMLVKWFPDRRGLITGIAVAGFGAGALITAPVANRLIDPADVSATFLPLGIAYLVATLIGGSFFRNPPEGYAVPGFEPSAARVAATSDSYLLGEALRSPQWYRLTGILTLNVTAGIALVSQAAPAAVAIAGMSAASAAGLVGILGIFNGAGRVLWGWGSDHMGRMPAFVTMFAIQVVCFVVLPVAGSTALFSVIAALVYLCYGGGFGTMPAAAADFFGPKNAGAIYGAMIVAWSLGGVVGPLAIAAIVDATGGFSTPFYIIAGLAAVSIALPLTTRKPEGRPAQG